MAILTTSGRAAMAQAIAALPIHLAWGSGDAAWDSAPVPEPVSAAGLVAEIGRRTAAQVAFALPNANGEIVVPTGRFSISQTPTNHLYTRFSFDFTDAPNSVIRELGVFVGTAMKSGQPAGKMYFVPADYQSAGTLLALERVAKFQRSPSVRQTFEFVLTI